MYTYIPYKPLAEMLKCRALHRVDSLNKLYGQALLMLDL